MHISGPSGNVQGVAAVQRSVQSESVARGLTLVACPKTMPTQQTRRSAQCRRLLWWGLPRRGHGRYAAQAEGRQPEVSGGRLRTAHQLSDKPWHAACVPPAYMALYCTVRVPSAVAGPLMSSPAAQYIPITAHAVCLANMQCAATAAGGGVMSFARFTQQAAHSVI